MSTPPWSHEPIRRDRKNVLPKEHHPRFKPLSKDIFKHKDRHLDDHLESESESDGSVCFRAIQRLKDSEVDFNEVLSSAEPFFDETFTFPDSIHWEDLSDEQYPLSGDEEKLEWKRITELYGNEFYSMWGQGDIRPADAIQGQLGNCWLISAAMSVSEKPERIHDIFKIETKNSASIYAMKLWLLGMPISVVIDDYLPVQEWDTRYTRYAQVASDGALWGALLEKSLAKYLGNYEAIDAGSGAHGVEAMTGAPYTTLTH